MRSHKKQASTISSATCRRLAAYTFNLPSATLWAINMADPAGTYKPASYVGLFFARLPAAWRVVAIKQLIKQAGKTSFKML